MPPDPDWLPALFEHGAGRGERTGEPPSTTQNRGTIRLRAGCGCAQAAEVERTGGNDLSSSLEDEPVIGSTFAGYRIEAQIGRGGMGVVYEATELRPERAVALKVVAPELVRDPAFRERFLREAEVAAQIDHPNVVPVLRVGEERGSLFIAMRLIRGVDLAGQIRSNGRLDPVRAARIVDQIADALDAAHALGLVHRDVKPSNVLLESGRRGDHAYLTDFGLTKLQKSDTQLTASGMLVGTFDYLAPEVIQGSAIDHRADIYALGAVLFEALTGEVPYPQGEHEFATLYAHVTSPPPVPSQRAPGVAPAFDAVIARAMAKDPGDRFQSAGELGAAAVAAVQSSAAPGVPRDTVTDLAYPAPSFPGPPTEIGAPPPATTPFAPAPAPIRAPPAPFAPAPQTGTQIRRRPIVRDTVVAARSVEPPAGATRIPLDPKFRYSQGPLPLESPIPLLSREELVTELARRVDRSAGGSVLITGFRGVGKTTVVDRALRRLRRLTGGQKVWVTVRINLGRPRTTAELLFEIIRALYEQLEDDHQLDALDPEARRVLETAYQRTSRSLKETVSSSREQNRGFGMTAGAAASIIGPKVDFSRKSASSLSGESAYLEYSDVDAEHDFARVVRLLGRLADDEPGKRGIGRLLRGKGTVPPMAVRLVVVLDELDKLAEIAGGTDWIRDLLTNIKNVLTVEGCNFVFVAGPELHDAVEDEMRRGGSIYESVFGWQAYVPCVWSHEAELLGAVIPDEAARASPQVQILRDHLAYTGRGVPRLLLRGLNALVKFDGDRPYLELGPKELASIEFNAGLERLIRAFVDAHAAADVPDGELDQWRLGVYYAVDWILRFKVTFTAQEVAALQSETVVDPMLALHEEEVQELLEHLVARGILEQVAGVLPSVTYYGDAPAARVAVYRLSDEAVSAIRRLTSLYGPSGGDGSELAVIRDEAAAFEGEVGETLAGGRYELIEELGRGGAGRTYRARDRNDGREVAIKLFDRSTFGGDELMRARFEREGSIALELEHPGIVATREVLDEPDGGLAIVTEFVPGPSLAEILATRGALHPEDAVAIAARVLDALDYVQAKGIARLDLSPGSIRLGADGAPTITNLTLAKYVNRGSASATEVGAVLGTPAYAPPEQLTGQPVDIRADLYAVALILFELIAGQRARDAEGVGALLDTAGDVVDLSALAISEDLRNVIRIALDPVPSRRYAEPAMMIAALRQTPEGALVAAL